MSHILGGGASTLPLWLSLADSGGKQPLGKLSALLGVWSDPAFKKSFSEQRMHKKFHTNFLTTQPSLQ